MLGASTAAFATPAVLGYALHADRNAPDRSLGRIALVLSALAEEPSEVLPWKVNKPIVSVKKEVYVKHPDDAADVLVFEQYVGPNL